MCFEIVGDFLIAQKQAHFEMTNLVTLLKEVDERQPIDVHPLKLSQFALSKM